MFCNLQTHIEDPAKRLRAIAGATSRAKEHGRAIRPTLALDWTQVVSRAMFGFVLGLMSRTPLKSTPIHNVIISNVAGPEIKLYGLGAEMKALYPLGPIFHGSGLNITVMSLSGKLNVGILPQARGEPVGTGRRVRDRTRQPAWKSSANLVGQPGQETHRGAREPAARLRSSAPARRSGR